MTEDATVLLDVRPILAAGGEPFPQIMQAVKGLQAGQSLRLLATFEPIPLYSVLGRQGLSHSATSFGEVDWVILFSPDDATAKAQHSKRPAAGSPSR